MKKFRIMLALLILTLGVFMSGCVVVASPGPGYYRDDHYHYYHHHYYDHDDYWHDDWHHD